MQITIVGDGGLTGALVTLATRAGHTIVRVDETTTTVAFSSPSEMIIVAGDRSAVTGSVARAVPMTSEDSIIVDATVTGESTQRDGEQESVLENDWMSLLPSTRIVRAFASVPAEALALIADREVPPASDGLAVPLAGDDAAAKDIVAEFMRQIGVEPFDLGPLTVSYVMEPGGPLWGRAVDSLDMRECIGWLSGGG